MKHDTCGGFIAPSRAQKKRRAKTGVVEELYDQANLLFDKVAPEGTLPVPWPKYWNFAVQGYDVRLLKQTLIIWLNAAKIYFRYLRKERQDVCSLGPPLPELTIFWRKKPTLKRVGDSGAYQLTARVFVRSRRKKR